MSNRDRWLAGVSTDGPGGRDMRRHALEAIRRAIFAREEAGEGVVLERIASHPLRSALAKEAQRPVDCPTCGALAGRACLALCEVGDDGLEEVS